MIPDHRNDLVRTMLAEASERTDIVDAVVVGMTEDGAPSVVLHTRGTMSLDQVASFLDGIAERVRQLALDGDPA